MKVNGWGLGICFVYLLVALPLIIAGGSDVSVAITMFMRELSVFPLLKLFDLLGFTVDLAKGGASLSLLLLLNSIAAYGIGTALISFRNIR